MKKIINIIVGILICTLFIAFVATLAYTFGQLVRGIAQ